MAHLARLLLAAAACSGAFGADPDPADIVRRAVANDEQAKNAAALPYSLTERQRTRNLDEAGGVKSVSARSRDIRMPDYLKHRERYRRAIREIPEAFVFRLSHEETVNLRPCFVIEISPRPGFQPVDRFSKLFGQLRGRLWIDKAEYRWVKLEAELTETVTFGWILVRIHRGSRARLTQELVNNEAWLPREMWYRASVRIGLVSLRGFETEARYGDYRIEAPPSPASP
ncbi:MAG: hypothetical protein IT159_02415 [Bryobacterales bacterium]|nr:hypothetical protein [Bryobacterales bacterium]